MFKRLNPRHNRVRKGAALLDELFPDWEKEVNTRNLDQSLDTLCVLGQVTRDKYLDTIDKLGFNLKEAIDHGFVEPVPIFASHLDKYDQLSAAWRELINYRRDTKTRQGVS